VSDAPEAWHLDKKVPLALIVAIVGQTLAAVWWAAGMAARTLQGVVGAAMDGAIGPRTLAALARVEPREVVQGVCDARMAFLRSLGTWSAFGRGWTRRVGDVRQKALAMAVPL